MKEGFIIKNAHTPFCNKDIELINRYTRRTLKADEVYIFSVVLCDNDIDRDFECFTTNSLKKLSDLFVGKTGILNHDAKSENQIARIFSCKTESVSGRFTKNGDQYCHLIARAYIPKIDKNKDLINEIDMGIKKEVSVGCSIKDRFCSICGTNLNEKLCIHNKGKYYDKDGKSEFCYVELDNPTDAYEWSFVAVPAQENAGVIKNAYKNNTPSNQYDLSIDKIKDYLICGNKINLTEKQSLKIGEYIKKLEVLAKYGECYKEKLKVEVIKLSKIAQPDLKNGVMSEVIESMDIDKLLAFKESFLKAVNKLIPPKPQLSLDKNKNNEKNKNNIQFKI